MLDEVEELDLVLEHYAITWGAHVPENAQQQGWETWGLEKARTRPSDSDDDEQISR
jgi:[phosphatase 2A protein]-leucine-carboxy methyltransferase